MAGMAVSPAAYGYGGLTPKQTGVQVKKPGASSALDYMVDPATGAFAPASTSHTDRGTGQTVAEDVARASGYDWDPVQGMYVQPSAAATSAFGAGAGAGGAVGSAGASAPAAAPNPALQSHLDELWSQEQSAPTYTAPQVPYETDYTDADRAFINRSKERVGHTLSGGVDALNAEMARRGISGDSDLAIGNLARLYRGAQSDQAETERQLVEGKRVRNQAITDENFQAQVQAARDNQAAQTSARSRLSALLGYYGMLY